MAAASTTSYIPPPGTSGNPDAVNLTQVAGGSVQTGHGTASGAIRVELPTDGTGKVGVDTTQAGLTSIVSAAAEGSHVLKASAGTLWGLDATTGASAGYLMLFNATSAPADGAVTPIKAWYMPASTSLGVGWLPGPPLAFSTGITVVFSTTGPFTKTISATAFFSAEVV